MTCTCPKCTAEIELDATTLPPEGSFTKCAACHANLLIRKESFAKRALYNSTEIACAECGNQPGTSIYCQHCHAIYPEILIVETSSAAKRQLGKLLNSLKPSKNLKANSSDRQSHLDIPGVTAAGKSKKVKQVGQPAQLAAVVAVILIIALGGGFYWYQNKVATEYAENYVRALLGLKTARDHEISISARVAASWKAGAASTLTPAEQTSTASAKKDVNTLMTRLGKVPDKFAANNTALTKLHASFGKLHDAATNPIGTSDLYAVTVKSMDEDFMKSAKELKAGLPEKITGVLTESKKTHKTLQEL
jgi:hypothetical protein